MVSSRDDEIDAAILAVVLPRWKKVAMVLAEVERVMGNKLPESEARWDLIAEPVERLVSGGRLMAQGNLKKWRHSEVRRPDPANA